MKTHPLAIYAVVLSTFLTYSGVGVGIGYYLWEKVGMPWWVLVLFSLGGLTLACWQVIRYQKRVE